MSLKKLSLGTANFAKNYGKVSGTKISFKEIKKIFAFSKKKKIKLLDTALSYQNSEILNQFNLKKWKIVTKVNCSDPDRKDYLINLRKNLNILNIYGVLIHLKNKKEILSKGNVNLYNLLKDLKKKKIIKKIGFSIYEPKDADAILGNYNIDLIQIPLNLFDRRFEKQGYLEKFKKKHIEIHTRSIFLQGLLLENKVPKNFKHWTRNFKQIDEWTSLNNISKLQACIQYILGIAEVDKVIIGVNNLRQLKQIVKNFKKPSRHINFSQNFGSSNLKLIDPRKWI